MTSMELLAFVITPFAVLALGGFVAWVAGRPPPTLRRGEPSEVASSDH